MADCVLVVHGGAWRIPKALTEKNLAGVEEAAEAGWKVLQSGGSAVQAVETAVVSLENNPVFCAGYGSVLTDCGDVEMDALIMDGSNLKSGAVAAVSTSPNPVKLARYVMDKTDHTLVVGHGAQKLATQSGLATVEPSTLVTAQAIDEWKTYKQYNHAVHSLFSVRPEGNELKVGDTKDDKTIFDTDGDKSASVGHDTVGCVALDSKGNMAAATSTGGIVGKMTGRVGDSPLVGAGGYADNQVGCISTTGHGESITRVCLAHTAINLLEQGSSPTEAAKKALNKMSRKVGGAGGMIIIDKFGDFSVEFTTDRMVWASIKANTMQSGIDPAQKRTRKFP